MLQTLSSSPGAAISQKLEIRTWKSHEIQECTGMNGGVFEPTLPKSCRLAHTLVSGF